MSPDIGGIQCGGNPGETAYYVQYYTDYFTATIAKIENSGDTKLTEANSEAVALSAIQRKQEKNKFSESTTRAAQNVSSSSAPLGSRRQSGRSRDPCSDCRRNVYCNARIAHDYANEI
ncbi:GL15660 [Drosophila persimilis]|uniref:GL15660 n=1 Tax=Drosophila persimilis TaxID=7234 RepID=B4IRT8_DROPE|nr:GL15660 [Drosophila persimilis]